MEYNSNNNNNKLSLQHCQKAIKIKMCRLTSKSSSSLFIDRKSIILALILITLAVFLLNPTNSDQLVEGKKAKKAIKSLVKGLILQNLSTRKNFLPLPVPIPGKWQQFLITMLDSGVFDKSKKTSLKVDKANNNNKEKKLLTSVGYLVNSLSNRSKLSSPSASQSAAEINNNKKLTRLAMAKYAGKLISKQAPSGSSSSKGATHGGSRSSSFVQQATSELSTGAVSAVATDRNSGNKRNDMLVTAFNAVKLAQQIREIDPSKLLNISKKSSFPLANGARIPLVSININNRKTFMNKMHYIHKLTYDLHHRHRNNLITFI